MLQLVTKYSACTEIHSVIVFVLVCRPGYKYVHTSTVYCTLSCSNVHIIVTYIYMESHVTKVVLIVKPEYLSAVFTNTNIRITAHGQWHLGAALGSRVY